MEMVTAPLLEKNSKKDMYERDYCISKSGHVEGNLSVKGIVKLDRDIYYYILAKFAD